MSKSSFKHVAVKGYTVVLPENHIDIDDELEYFDNNPKKLARQKKMIGFGRRYVADELTTVTDLAEVAATRLFRDLDVSPDEIEALIVVDHTPDYLGPCDACILHGRLGLKRGIPAFDVNISCSGYIYGLWLAHTMIESGAVRNCLVVAGDLATSGTKQSNRKRAPLFSDSASATLLAFSEEECSSNFIMGTDGKGWEYIVKPIGGSRLPYAKELFDLSVCDSGGNEWTCTQEMMKGEEVFAFTMEVVPWLIREALNLSCARPDDIDLYAIHQANKQIVEMIVGKAGIPIDRTPTDVFSRYANATANSVLTVLCDPEVAQKRGRVLMTSFGAGLSWAAAVLNLESARNLGVSFYTPPEGRASRPEQLDIWVRRFKGDNV